jgi:hypothetical protein
MVIFLTWHLMEAWMVLAPTWIIISLIHLFLVAHANLRTRVHAAT